MATTRWFFPATRGASYRGNGTRLLEPGLYQGQSPHAPDGNTKSYVLFDYNYIRSILRDQIPITCFLDFRNEHWFYGSGGVAVVGYTNHTEIVDRWDWDRVDTNEWRRHVDRHEQVRGWNLGWRLGYAFRNGQATGITFGPGPNSSYSYYGYHSNAGEPSEPVLVIDSYDEIITPWTPRLSSPDPSVVRNMVADGITFDWQHRDLFFSRQAYWRLQRRSPNGTNQWWRETDGTWVTTETRNSGSSTSKALSAAQWTASGGSAPGEWLWRVSTADSSGYNSPYTTFRSIWQSIPPSVNIVAPADDTDVTVTRPTITWEYGDPDGTAQFGWIAMVVPSETFRDSDWSPESYTGTTWTYSGDDTRRTVKIDVDLANHRTYRAYVRVTSSPSPSSGLQFSAFDYVEFTTAFPPAAPVITSPQNGATVDLSAGFALAWDNRHVGSGTQAAFAIRRLGANNTYEWWNGAGWLQEEYYLAGGDPSYSFRANENFNGVSYTYSVAIRDGYGQVSPYSVGVSLLGSSAAQVTVLDPPEIAATTQPFVSWSVYDLDNDPQQTWQVRILPYTGLPDEQINPGTDPAAWDSGEQSSTNVRSTTVPVDLINAMEYRAYVRVMTGGVHSGWAFAQFAVQLQAPALPSVVVSVLDDEGAVSFAIQGRDSILTSDASLCVDGWTVDDDSTLGDVDFVGSVSGHAMRLTANSTHDSIIVATEASAPAAATQPFAASVTFVKEVNEVPVYAFASVEFLNADGEIIQVMDGETVVDESALTSTVETVSPVGTSLARLRVTFLNVPVGGDHFFYDPVLRPGDGYEWSPGGLLGSTSVTLVEANDGREVRRARNVPLPVSTQQVVIRDEEVPIGRVQAYRLTTRAVYPNTILSSPVNEVPDVRWASGWLWVSDPYRLRSARAFGPQSFDPVTRPVRQGKFRPLGRPDAVFTAGTRGWREGSFTILTRDRAERNAYLSLVDESDVVLLRIPPDQGDPEGETLYVKLEGDAPEERPLPSRTPHRTIKQTWSEQRRPADGIEYGTGP